MPGQVIRLGGLPFEVSRLSLSVKGQDRDLVADDLIVVIDGASPVSPGPVDVGDFAAAAAAALAAHEPVSLTQRVRCAINEVGVNTGDVSTPSAALVVAQARDGWLEVGVLGDCVGVAITHAGEVLMAPRDERLAAIDAFHAAQIGEIMSRGLSFEIARSSIRDSLIAQRLLVNTESGYWIFCHDPAAADHLGQFRTPLAEVDALLLCSDGFARLWELFGVVSEPGALVRLARQMGLPAAGRLLRSLEEAPDSVIRAPRVSQLDDATALLLTRV
jgi:hypothetical protein